MVFLSTNNTLTTTVTYLSGLEISVIATGEPRYNDVPRDW